jgi:hypothetical protein
MAGVDWSLDWSTALLLAAVTLLEGFRRVPAGAMLVTRLLAGPWIHQGETRSSGLRLASWFSPFVLHLVLPPVSPGDSSKDLRRRWRRVRRWLPMLRIVGMLHWLLLVLGLPLAVARWSWLGLILALSLVFSCTILLAILSAVALDQAVLARAEIVKHVRGLLSPFAAPRATEIVVEAALAGAPPLEVLRLLLPPDDYWLLLRPLAYDVERGTLSPLLLEGVPDRVIQTALNSRPEGEEASPYCPRCGQTYQSTIERCDDCGGVALRLS